jgi:hypothetical protein
MQKQSNNLPNVGSNRSLDTVIRTATVIAKPKLKRVMGVSIIKKATHWSGFPDITHGKASSAGICILDYFTTMTGQLA